MDGAATCPDGAAAQLIRSLGALAIRHATYQQLYLTGAAIAAATAIVYTWASQPRVPRAGAPRPDAG